MTLSAEVDQDAEFFDFTPLSPGAFLTRAAQVFAGRTAIVDEARSFTYGEFHARVLQLTAVLESLSVSVGDRVAAMCANSHVMLEIHAATPIHGSVLVPLNVRLSVPELEYIVGHSGAKVLIATAEFAQAAAQVATACGIRVVIAGGGDDEYERLLQASAAPVVREIDERSLLAINYTSGTTGRPKGVMYHHRGAYLQSIAMAYHTQLVPASNYLWTLPMFHCDGWCFTWAVTAAGATHVCLRSVDTARIWHLLKEAGITHFSAAPTVLNMISADPSAAHLPDGVNVTTGGAPPSPTQLRRMAELGMSVTHLYGMTETFGPIMVNQWQPEWDELTQDEIASKQARQGIGNIIARQPRVVASDGTDVPDDGITPGELLVSGNDVMLGYYRDPDATRAAMVDGWLSSGDLAVKHADGYVELKDRIKDVIITGGENVASVEVERVLDAHPAVLESAVVGRHDDRWGEVPVAFVTLRGDPQVTDADLIEFARGHLARFKIPKQIVFGVLPKTSTGKIQKHILRDRLKN
ncbi:AMP-binding protein [Mycobacterium sp. NAZ190054]|uniref:AMP-binding protein n=1 Tax=Mycobacterium sp. NAZ190054 TaxID=1747766 RepID=UPI00079B5D1B|nr:AMP-binding protein [Mycobacterium sp. NAZ190054]KWX69287.1 acyl-CoA synthetase [Mycobacterium sp. NAZ190054]